MFRNILPVVSILILTTSLFAQKLPLINQDRLEHTLFKLADYGKKENGETSRVAFSDADIAGRSYVMDLMKEAGMAVHIDFAGNIVGRREGTDDSKKQIAFGSHIDMVPDGGNYDGIVGSLSAIEVVRTLKESGVITRHPLEVIVFANEEGGVMGSRALAGTLRPEAMVVRNSTGYTIGEGINRIGGNTSRLEEVRRKKGDLTAFVELHIEQGGILDQTGTDIGVVQGIVGISWWDVEVLGVSNHAGTTPMDQRQDALLAASRFVIAVNEAALAHEGRQVATVGRIHAEPGAPNVIPGRVTLSLEIRDLSAEKIRRLFEEIKERAGLIAKSTGTTFSFTPIDATGDPALTDERIRKLIVQAAESLHLSHMEMPSGAGHDAQDMALIAPAGMIFVPSEGGISHSPKEFTKAPDIANGANVLLRTLLAIDRDWD